MKDHFTRAGKRVMAALLSLTCPQRVRTNQDTGLIKLIACLCMFIDHAGKMLFPQYPVMRQIGRLAFPLFAYGIAVGAVYTKNPVKYLTRVVLLALISQPLYALGLAHENRAMYAVPFFENPFESFAQFYLNSWQKPSILLSLSLCLLIILCMRHKQWILALGAYVLCVRMAGKLDYGIEGIHLMLLFYMLCEHPLLCFAATFAFMFNWARQGIGYTFFGMSFALRVYSLPSIVLACLPMKRRIRLPQWFSYGFYPAHLIVLILLVKVF